MLLDAADPDATGGEAEVEPTGGVTTAAGLSGNVALADTAL